MTTPSLQYWYRADITFKDLTTTASTTYSFLNRPEIGSTDPSKLPLLKSVSGLGARMGKILPELGSAIVSLNISRSSFGYERRVFDLLERSTPIAQTVIVYYAETALETLSVSSWTEVWRGTVKDWRCRLDADPTLDIELKNNLLETRVVTKVLDTDFIPDLPSSSIGKELPLVLGEGVTVKPVLIDDESTAPSYAYATTFSDEFFNSGLQGLRAKADDGFYYEVSSAAGYAAYSQTNSETTYYSPAADQEVIFHQIDSVSDGYILTRGKIRMMGIGIPWNPGDDDFTLEIWSSTEDGAKPDELVGKGQRSKADFEASFEASAAFWAEFTFQKPVVVGKGKNYWFGVRDTGFAQGTSDPVFIAIDGTSLNSIEAYQLKGSDTWIIIDPGLDWKYELYGVEVDDHNEPNFGGFTPDPLDSGGLSLSYAILTQQTAILGIDNPDLSKLDLVFVVDGIQDDGSGTLSGSANAVLEDARSWLKLLDRTWNGSTWGAGNFNFSTYASTLSRLATFTTAGRTYGRKYSQEVLVDICDELGVRIAYIKNTSGDNLAPWAWGTDIGVTTKITKPLDDEKEEIGLVESLGVETVANSVNVLFERSLLSPRTAASGVDYYQSQSTSDYLGSILWDKDTSASTAVLATNSEAIYGKRETFKIEYDWISSQATAEERARALLAINAHPHIFSTLEAPFADYFTLDLLEIITISDPALPAYFGTSPSAKLPYYSDEVDILGGHYWKRANTWRAQVEGYEILFDQTKPPTLRLTVRLLNNYPNDPT